MARVVSIPVLAALKILAWRDRGLSNNKDAEDFCFLLKNYHRAAGEGRLYDEAYSLLEASNYDVELAGASLLGYDASVVLTTSTREAVLGILGDTQTRDRLIIHMDRSFGADAVLTQHFVTQFEHALALSQR